MLAVKESIEGKLLGITILRTELLYKLAAFEDEITHFTKVIEELDFSIGVLKIIKESKSDELRNDDSTGDASGTRDQGV